MSFDRVPLGDVCEITMGQAPSGETYNTDGKGLPLIAGAGDFGTLSPEATKFTNAPTKVSRQGDIILCIRATIGDRNWSDAEYCLGRGVAGLAGRPQHLDQTYLWHWLGYAASELKSKGRGATFLQVNKADIASLGIPLPSLAEQRRIAAILDKADALRVKRREAIAKLDQLLQSVFLDMFGGGVDKGCPAVPLADAFWFQEGPGVRKWQFRDAGVKLLNVGNIEKDGSINLAKTDRHVSIEEAHGKYQHFLVDEGDLVIASSGVSFDQDGMLRTRGGFISKEHLPLCMNTSTIRFKAIAKKSDLRYLQVWIGSHGFRSQITKLVTGSAQQNFGPSHLRQLVIPLPPIDQQEAFARRAEQIGASKDQHQRSLSRMDAAFQSLQQAAFSGVL